MASFTDEAGRLRSGRRGGRPYGDYRTPGSPSDAWASLPRSVHSQPSEQIGVPSDVHSWSATG
jgi:hypothetical protein